jgi:hypothetical protein
MAILQTFRFLGDFGLRVSNKTIAATVARDDEQFCSIILPIDSFWCSF